MKLVAAALSALALGSLHTGVDAADAVVTQTLMCQSCMAATDELIKRTPILRKWTAKKAEKELPLYENFDGYCQEYNFRDYVGTSKEGFTTSDFSKGCRAMLKQYNTNNEIPESLLKTADSYIACAPICADIPDEQRDAKPGNTIGFGAPGSFDKKSDSSAPAVDSNLDVEEADSESAEEAAKPADGSKPKPKKIRKAKKTEKAKAGKKGTVDDPKVKEALLKSAKRKAARDAKKGKKSAREDSNEEL